MSRFFWVPITCFDWEIQIFSLGLILGDFIFQVLQTVGKVEKREREAPVAESKILILAYYMYM